MSNTSLLNALIPGLALAHANAQDAYAFMPGLQTRVVPSRTVRIVKMARFVAPEMGATAKITAADLIRSEMGNYPSVRIRATATDLATLSDYGIAVEWDEAMMEEIRAAGLNPDEAVIKLGTELAMGATEGAFHSTAVDTSALPDAAAGAKWDVATTDPRDDIDGAIEAMEKAIGGFDRRRVTGYCNRSVFNAARKSPKFLAALTTPGRDVRYLSESELAQQFDIGRIVVSSARWQTNQDGVAVTADYIWTTDAFTLAYDGPAGGLGVQPAFSRLLLPNGGDFKVETHKIGHKKWSTLVSLDQAIATIDPSSAFVITDCLT